MVYTGKPSRGCQMCRKRRIKCDETKPTCLQCHKSRRECPGYLDDFDLVFRNETQATEKRAQRSVAVKRVAPQASPRLQDGFSINSASKSSWAGVYASMAAMSVSDSPFVVSTVALDSISVSVDQQAQCYFMSNFVLIPRGSNSRGYFDYLVPMIKSEGPGSHLAVAFDAVAMAAFANRPSAKARGLMQKACLHYTNALKMTNVALQTAELQRSDQTLAAILLLGFFESITSERTNVLAWGSHVEGAAQLVKMRGRKQMRSKVGLGLFAAVRTQMIVQCMSTSKPPMLGTDWWLADPTKDASTVAVTKLNLRVVELRAETNQALQSASRSPEVIQEVLVLLSRFQEIEQEYIAWEDSLPDFWRVQTSAWVENMPRDLLTANFLPGKVDMYDDIFIANLWNHARVSRIFLSGMIVRCAAWICSPGDHRTTPEYLGAVRACEGMIREIIASIPFHLGWRVSPMGELTIGDFSGFACGIETPASPKALGGFLCMWPLFCASSTDFATDAQRLWIKGRLHYISDSMGLNQARVLDSLQLRLPSMIVLRDNMNRAASSSAALLERFRGIAVSAPVQATSATMTAALAAAAAAAAAADGDDSTNDISNPQVIASLPPEILAAAAATGAAMAAADQIPSAPSQIPPFASGAPPAASYPVPYGMANKPAMPSSATSSLLAAYNSMSTQQREVIRSQLSESQKEQLMKHIASAQAGVAQSTTSAPNPALVAHAMTAQQREAMRGRLSESQREQLMQQASGAQASSGQATAPAPNPLLAAYASMSSEQQAAIRSQLTETQREQYREQFGKQAGVSQASTTPASSAQAAAPTPSPLLAAYASMTPEQRDSMQGQASSVPAGSGQAAASAPNPLLAAYASMSSQQQELIRSQLTDGQREYFREQIRKQAASAQASSAQASSSQPSASTLNPLLAAYASMTPQQREAMQGQLTGSQREQFMNHASSQAAAPTPSPSLAAYASTTPQQREAVQGQLSDGQREQVMTQASSGQTAAPAPNPLLATYATMPPQQQEAIRSQLTESQREYFREQLRKQAATAQASGAQASSSQPTLNPLLAAYASMTPQQREAMQGQLTGSQREQFMNHASSRATASTPNPSLAAHASMTRQQREAMQGQHSDSEREQLMRQAGIDQTSRAAQASSAQAATSAPNHFLTAYASMSPQQREAMQGRLSDSQREQLMNYASSQATTSAPNPPLAAYTSTHPQQQEANHASSQAATPTLNPSFATSTLNPFLAAYASMSPQQREAMQGQLSDSQREQLMNYASSQAATSTPNPPVAAYTSTHPQQQEANHASSQAATSTPNHPVAAYASMPPQQQDAMQGQMSDSQREQMMRQASGAQGFSPERIRAFLKASGGQGLSPERIKAYLDASGSPGISIERIRAFMAT